MNYFECMHCGREITGDAKISFTDGGAICNDCTLRSDFDFPQEARLAFAKLFTFDWQEKFTLTQRQITLTEEILWRYVQSIIGKELNSIKFIRSMQKN